MADHILTGLVAGLTKEEVTEIIVQTAVFAGFPVAINALTAMKDIFGVWDEIVG